MIKQLRQNLNVARLIVHAGEEGVLEEELATGFFDVVAGGVHERGDGVSGDDRHEFLAFFLERGMQGDGQVELLRLVGEAPDLVHQSACRDGDVPRRQAEAVRVVQDPERKHELFVVQHRLAHPHDDHVGDALGGDVPGGDEDLFGDLAGLEVALDTEEARRTEGTGHRAADLGRDADRPPVALGDHDRLYEVTVVCLEEVLARPVGCSRDADGFEDGGRGLLRERSPQRLGERGGLLPVTDQATDEGAVSLSEPEPRLVPAPQNLLYVRYELPGSQRLSPLRRRRDYTNAPLKSLTGR